MMRFSRYIPPWLLEKAASPPLQGAGLHQWVFECTRALKRYMPDDEAVAYMLAKSPPGGRNLEREIREAVRNVQTDEALLAQILSGETRPAAAEEPPRPRFPESSPGLIASIRRVPVEALADMSPSPFPGTEEALQRLFPGDPLICLGAAPWACAVRKLSSWAGQAAGYPFMVPSAMTAVSGRTVDGRNSPRCLANTGPRMYQVVEFDDREGFDSQAGRIVRLMELLRPTLVLHSGGKSLHAWFPAFHLSAEEQVKFFSAAATLGADTATWSRCQLVRVPGGTRAPGVAQTCFYFDDDAIPTQS